VLEPERQCPPGLGRSDTDPTRPPRSVHRGSEIGRGQRV